MRNGLWNEQNGVLLGGSIRRRIRQFKWSVNASPKSISAMISGKSKSHRAAQLWWRLLLNADSRFITTHFQRNGTADDVTLGNLLRNYHWKLELSSCEWPLQIRHSLAFCKDDRIRKLIINHGIGVFLLRFFEQFRLICFVALSMEIELRHRIPFALQSAPFGKMFHSISHTKAKCVI